MRETIERVETRGNELEAAEYPHTAFCHKEKLEDAPSSLKDRIIHQTYEVPVRPMIPIVPEPEPSLHLDISTHKTVSEAEDTNVSDTEDANVSKAEDKAAQMIEETRSANILTPEVIPVASSVDGALSDGDVSAWKVCRIKSTASSHIRTDIAEIVLVYVNESVVEICD